MASLRAALPELMLTFCLAGFIAFTAPGAKAQTLPFTIDASPAAISRTGLVSNTVIDILGHNNEIWFSTGKGLSRSTDGGNTWTAIRAGNGLVSDNISAVAFIGNRIWVGTNTTGPAGDGLAIFSDGVSYSDNNGSSWTQINFGATGQNISKVLGGNRTPFDLTGADNQIGHDYVFFAAFAGGLLGSADGGGNWKRIFPSATDSLQFVTEAVPSLVNRYFSCAIDTSHTDSVFLWAGTAGGLLQYVFISPRSKFSLSRVTAFARCAICTDSARLFIGGAEGVSLGSIGKLPSQTRTSQDGLPSAGPAVASMISLSGVLLAGTYNSSTGVATGLARSTDQGLSYAVISNPAFLGANHVIRDFAVIRARVYAAAGLGGVRSSTDLGLTWDSLRAVPGDPGNAFNHVNSLAAIGDTLYLGTDSGLAVLHLSAAGAVDSSSLFTFPENSSSSRKVYRVRVQAYTESATAKVAWWLANRPATPGGNSLVTYSLDRGISWQTKAAPLTNEILLKADSVFLLTAIGARLTSRDSLTPVLAFSVADSSGNGVALSNDSLLAGYVNGDTLVIGSNTGVAFSISGGRAFRVIKANTDPLRPDFVVNRLAIRDFINGDFVPSLGIQYRPGKTAAVWLSARPVSFGQTGVNRLTFDSAGVKIDTVLLDDFAWNFGFAGDTAYLATNTGLFQSIGARFDTLSITPTGGGATLVNPEATFFAVQPIDTLLWAGTDDGTLRYRLGGAIPHDPQLVAKVDLTTPANEVYAFPVPFSPGRGGTVDFHFTVAQAGKVTIEIYDFGMNLVARPIDAVSYAAGTYPNGSQQGRTWDGRNGEGKLVAVGTYYVKVTVDNGDPHWGKLVVIP